ncbi:MAG: alpha-2-macroglobulin, partial [Chitinophagaceae bacterium]
MMKTLLFFLATFFFYSLTIQNVKAQTIKNYEKDWKKVDDLLQKKGLPRSALEEVKKIYATAKKEGQEAQVIKALVYLINLQQETEEDGAVLGIKQVEKEITIHNEPATSILQSLLAGLYWQYLQNHRWLFYGRTQTKNFIKSDPATWTIEDFHQKISALYVQSISNETLLKKIGLAPYEALIIKGNTRPLRPTLYDLLAHKALDYFKNDERDIARPAYAFEIKDPAAFAPAEAFVAAKFSTKDSLSLKHKALLLYQQLIRFHLKDEKPNALLDVDIERLEYVKNNSVLPNKEELYQGALE